MYSLIKKALPMLLVIFFLMCLPGEGVAAEKTYDGGKLYLLLVDKLFFDDIDAETTVNINAIVQEGGIGLASNRTLKRHNSLDGSLTLGAGNLARAYNCGIMGFNRNEIPPERGQTAETLYANLTGIDINESDCLLVNLPEILSGIEEERVNTVPGALGDELRNNGIRTFLIGNGDIGYSSGKISRSAMAVAMDSKGQVPFGDIGPNTCLRPTDGYLFYETNYKYLREQFINYKDKADFFVIDLSDLARLEKADPAFPAINESEKKRYLARIDGFTGFIKEQMDPRQDLLLITSQSPAQEQIERKNFFTPVIFYGKGYEQGGLTSPTSRRDFIVANTDIAPSILNFFGLQDEKRIMIGRTIVSKDFTAGETLEEARNVANRSSTVNRLRVPIIKGYVAIEITIILLTLMVIFFLPGLNRVFQYLVLVLTAVPLVLLPLGKMNFSSDWLYIFLAGMASLLISIIFIRFFKGNSFKAFITLAILMVIGLNIDLLTGAGMIKTSVLGYDPMAGARYYGIGNEYLGILLGSVIVAAAAIYGKYRSKPVLWGIAIIFLCQIILIGVPIWGANSGGLITALLAFLMCLALLSEIKISPAFLLKILLVAIMLISAVVFYDLQRPVEIQSHIGRAAGQIIDGGWEEAFTIISRKLAMNIKLIKYTIWSRVFLVVLLVLSLLFYRPVGTMRRLRKKYPFTVKGFAGLIIAAFVVLLINDSGIVAASTASIYLVVPLLLLTLQIRRGDDNY